MIPGEIIKGTEQILRGQFNEDIVVLASSGVGGGCINDAYRLDTTRGQFFVKYNDARRYPGMFESEAKGLKLLKESKTVGVPGVIGQGESGKYSFLVLEYIDAGNKASSFWSSFGESLATMHRFDHVGLEVGAGKESAKQTPHDDREVSIQNKQLLAHHKRFGLDHDNYIGSLPQSNRWHDAWIDFFVNERLEAQVKLAIDTGRTDPGLVRLFQKLYNFLSDFFPDEPPALLHGDLWSGNYMCDNSGKAVIIDPAVYFGHRYMDLGMSKLFGGFSQLFYDAYNEAYPLEQLWEDGVEIANLYPLMVHVNLFGGGYLQNVKSILRRFS